MEEFMMHAKYQSAKANIFINWRQIKHSHAVKAIHNWLIMKAINLTISNLISSLLSFI